MLALLVLHMFLPVPNAPRPYLHMPSVDSFAKHDPSGVTILPEGRLLTPAGFPTPVSRWPYGLVLTPDGQRAFVASEGAGQWLDDWQTKSTVTHVTPGRVGKRGNSGACALSPDGKHLYWSSGETGGVNIVNAATNEVEAEISLNGQIGGEKFEDSYVNDIGVSADGRYLFC